MPMVIITTDHEYILIISIIYCILVMLQLFSLFYLSLIDLTAFIEALWSIPILYINLYR